MNLKLSIATVCAGLSLSTLAWARESLSETLKRSKEIDALVQRGYEKLKVKANEVVPDGIFVRRAYLNIVGRIPTGDEARSFINNKQPAKRTQLIDKLVGSEGFKSTMFLFYSELLRLQSNKEQYGAAMHQYIYESVQTNKPYDKFVYEMLAAKGHVAENPAVSYYLRDPGMTLDNVSNTAQVFLGTQIGCAQCHDHPFEDTTQMDFYQLAAFSGGFRHKSSPAASEQLKKVAEFVAGKKGISIDDLKRAQQKRKKKGKKVNRNILRNYAKEGAAVFKYYRRNDLQDNERLELKLPDDYQYNDGKAGDIVKPKALFGDMPKLESNKDRRKVFAKWVTAPNNPQFTKVIANRLWAHTFGYGLAEPLDNWTDRTKISHKPALDFLATEMKRNNYDVEQTLRTLFHTKLFQRSVSPLDVEGGKTYNFTGPLLRRMTGEEIHDSLMTLEEGKLDHKKNVKRIVSWKNYLKNYKTIKALPAERIVDLAKNIQKADRASAGAKREAKALKLAANKARANGDNETYKRLMKQMRTKYRKAKSQTAQSMQGMQSMQMLENSDATASDLMKFAMNRNLRMARSKRLRASEMEQPFRAGSFVREFGSTDGEVSNNSSDHASIPQALSLLNGREIMAVTDRKGSLARQLMQAKTAEKRLEILFLAIYSRYPSKSEITKFLAYTKSYKDIPVLAKAMINSKSFLFVQ